MASEVEICNIALANIRAQSINSFNEGSLQAQTCKLMYPILRDQLFEDVAWSFAHAVKPLSLLTLEAFGWGYVYQYPNDCLRVNKLIPNFNGVRDNTFRYDNFRGVREDVFGYNGKVEYEIQNIDDVKVIVSDLAELRIDYRMLVTDPNKFTNQFKLTLAHLIASEIAVPIVGAEMGRQLRSDSYQIYTRYLAAASASNSNQQYSVVPESEFITTRR
jgi:hypothetical protein